MISLAAASMMVLLQQPMRNKGWLYLHFYPWKQVWVVEAVGVRGGGLNSGKAR